MALIACPECRTQVSDQAAACPKCARPLRAKATNAGTCAVLSLVIAGAGQIYRGDVGLGLLWMVLVYGAFFGVHPLIGAIFAILCVIEAYADWTNKGATVPRDVASMNRALKR